MQKKLALILISMDECFTKEGFSGGGHNVTKNLILGLIESNKFDIDIYCQKGINAGSNFINGINSITVIDKKNFKRNLETKIKEQKYDYVLSSDILLPFANNLIHSNSSKYKSKNCKNKFMQFVLGIYNAKKISNQNNNLPRNKAIFTVSESLKKDYVENFELDEKKVFACIPALNRIEEKQELPNNEFFTIGSIAGGGLNKGGYLLLMAIKRLPKKAKIKARIIFPKFKKAFFYKLMVKLLGLKKRIEILPKQKNMNEYYKTIDCYVLPSLNEAFGLVVTEAASNLKPSIVSSTTGVRELIEDGKNGFVFDRSTSPVKNLSNKIVQVSDMYLNNNQKFQEVSNEAYEMIKKLDWKKFTDTIINNLVGENESY